MAFKEAVNENVMSVTELLAPTEASEKTLFQYL